MRATRELLFCSDLARAHPLISPTFSPELEGAVRVQNASCRMEARSAIAAQYACRTDPHPKMTGKF